MTKKSFLSILGLFQVICDRYPNNIAVQDSLEALTYSALDRRSSSLARRLQRAGASPSQVIPILTSSCLHMVVGVLAILKTGGTYVPIDRDLWPRDRIEDVLQRTSSGLVVFTGKKFKVPKTTMINAEEATDMDWADGVEEVVLLPELAAIIFTSGTTGKPKGVEIRHESLTNFVTSVHFNYDITPDDRVLLVLSVGFDACMGTLFNTLCNGGTVVLANRSNLQNQSYLCSVIAVTPSILEAMEPPESQYDYPSLDRIVMGGETPSQRLLETWSMLRRPIWIAYGPTEATCATLMGIVQRCPDSREFRPTILGTAIKGAQVTIVNNTGKEIDALGEEGELLIAGSGLARGYWHDECRSSEKFVIRKGIRTYKTGDFAKWRVDMDGARVVEFCGRRDRTVKIRGFLVNLEQDVDVAMLAMEPSLVAVHSVLVGKKFYTVVSPVPEDIKLLKARWMAKVPGYLVPDHMVGLHLLPTTANGKVDTQEIARVITSTVTSIQNTPEDGKDFRAVVLNSMARILEIPASTINVNQSFVSQGLHSLAAVILCAHCRNLGFLVSVEDLLTVPSIDSLLQISSSRCDAWTEGTSTSHFASEAPLTRLQKMLIYDSVEQKTLNIVQHIAVYRAGDIPRLQAAWRTVVDAEPIFRTVLDLDTEMQRLVDKAPFHWIEHGIESQQEMEFRTDEAAAAAGLGACFTVLHCLGPLLPYNESILIFSIHHALMDGFSASLILNKVGAVLDGRSFEPSLPFTAAVESLQQHAARTAIEADAFWRQQEFAFPDPTGEMMLPKPPANKSSGHAECCVETGLDVGALAKCGQSGSTTPAAFHYAAWALVLSSYTNADTVVFGAVVSARALGFAGADSIVGPLMDTAPLRITIDQHTPSAALVHQIYHGVRALAKFQTTAPKGGLPHFTSALAIQYDSPARDACALQPLRVPMVAESPALPLSILVEEDGRIRFVYRRSAFCDEDVRHMATVYRNLLHAYLINHTL